MASGAITVSVVKSGYWTFGKDPIRLPSEIPSELFTHLYAGFAKVDDDGRLVIPDEYLELFQLFTRTVRVRNPSVKTLLSIGGEGADLCPVVASKERRANLIRDSIDLARKFGFDGLDLCWLYPSNASRQKPLASLLSEWRHALDEELTKTESPADKLLLTAAVFHHPVISDTEGHIIFSYPIPDISKNLDWINVLAIDFYTPSNSPKGTGPVHAWDTRPMDRPKMCGKIGIEEWIKSGVEANKLVLGLPFYGYEWKLLKEKTEFGFFAPARVETSNSLSYRDILKELRRGIYKTEYSRSYEAVYSHEVNGKKWIGYDDGCSITGKVTKALFVDFKLRGYFAWHLEDDDCNWTLSRSAFESSVEPPAPEANP
ncbi:hypothetical protein F2P56_013644 [Juglans regia]|uniref:Class V chitinase-like n=2 Tax=Juglans regia TaxID=51240 RepID=A0A2I4FEM0_JUGRE|nr:class V chitinase-like [Juglans regia]KAF5469581.1 hypothetical protein F2P56_013644 [Juglans regia]